MYNNYDSIQSLTGLLKENDLSEAAERKMPRTYFTDTIDTRFWTLNTIFQVQMKPITKEEMRLLPHVWDAFVSPEIRREIIMIRPDLRERQKSSLRISDIRSGDSVCLIRGDISCTSMVLMTFTSAPKLKGVHELKVGYEISPLYEAETSFHQLRHRSFALDRVFFTADTHFSEERILKYRPKFSSIEEMDAYIIGRWNDVVPDNGIVFHLGDFSDTDINNINRVAGMLKGKIYLVPGNHDNDIRTKHLCREGRAFITCLEPQKTIQYRGRRIILNHYPLLCYSKALSGQTWQLFGHVHTGAAVLGNDTPRMQYLLPYQYDVGVENNDYRPISLRQVMEIMEGRKAANSLINEE